VRRRSDGRSPTASGSETARGDDRLLDLGSSASPGGVFIPHANGLPHMDVLHTAVWVSDLDTTVEFYENVLGLGYAREFVDQDGVTNYFVDGESGAKIQFKHDENRETPVDSGTLDHLAVAVEDVAATAERAVEEWGSEVVDGPRDLEDHGVRVAFVTDPEGYTVEIVQEI
jgi:lactoylglutathione lyase